jgi:putative hemolysin
MELLIILMLILLNGVFAMSEIALVSSKKVRLEAAAKSGKKGAATALKLSLAPNRFLSTVQIGITLIGLLTGIYSGENITNTLEAYLVQFEPVKEIADGLAVTIVLVAITFSSLLLGELIPKRIGLANPERIARFVAPLMKFLSTITHPFVWILTNTSDIILKILNIDTSKKNKITEEEIKAIIQEGTQGGEIQKIEQDIVERVFMLGDRKINSLMTNRTDLTFININNDFKLVRDTINKDLHRIYPVVENDKDNILGVVMLKDLFVAFQSDNFNLRNYLKPAQYLTESTSAYKALEKFKTSRVNYSLVTNEYGLVIGIITINDILQALVGDVSEFYMDDYQLSQREDGSWLVDGQYPISEFMRQFDIDYINKASNITTVAGVVLWELNHIPKIGEKIVWNGLELEVLDMDNIKIDKILVKPLGENAHLPHSTN